MSEKDSEHHTTPAPADALAHALDAIERVLITLPPSRDLAAWRTFSLNPEAQDACASAILTLSTTLVQLRAVYPEHTAVRHTLDEWQAMYPLLSAAVRDMDTLTRTFSAPDPFSQSLPSFRDDLTYAGIKDTR
jgi:hypothetical protein